MPTDSLHQYLELKLAANGCQTVTEVGKVMEVTRDLIDSYRERVRLLDGYLSAPDQRIQDFLDRHFADVASETGPVQLMKDSFLLDKPGLARLLSLPPGRDEHKSPILTSYRIRQGVLHNPKSDRRQTQGTFHICAGGLPVPGDKKEVPKIAFARLFQAAMNTPPDNLALPYAADCPTPARLWVSLLIRPLVVPPIPALNHNLARPAQRSEIRFFAPGTLVSNLDFIEQIFGNAGNPHLAENDAGLEAGSWTGHTGCIILAPHLVTCTKKALGLPHVSQATPRQRRDGMCYEQDDELYNDGNAFKCTCRNAEGVMVTLIADNYYGYCKKEVKTQIGYAANLLGAAEEEHAGGALAFSSYHLGEEWSSDNPAARNDTTFSDVVREFAPLMDLHPEGYGTDRRFPSIVYVPEGSRFSIKAMQVAWAGGAVRLRGEHTYVLPSGYKVRLEKHPGAASWRLVGTVAEGTFCHKPCTVSGGGKSEISKSIADAIIYGPLFVANLEADLDLVASLLKRDYGDRFKSGVRPGPARDSRPVLDPGRSLGSVIKLYTPTEAEFSPAYNAWLATIPTRILTLLFIVKRFYRPEWGADWRTHFTVDVVNGAPGHQVKIDGRPLVASYLRVGTDTTGAWRTFKLRQDFIPADKVQMEDDITASVVLPADWLDHLGEQVAGKPSIKLALNCEAHLFQRPDDAIHRGIDKQAEADLAGVNGPVFVSNFEPLSTAQAKDLLDDPIGYGQWTKPMRRLVREAAAGAPGNFMVSSAHPRIVDGKPTKNPRYLQPRPDVIDARGTWLAEVGTRLHRRVPLGRPVVQAVSAVLAGRRNNPPEKGVRPLAVHGPLHFQELPELFMEFASSLTGKSPSTTGAGSEGALTKGPFNALTAFADLDNALLGMILTGYDGWTTSAGCIGPHLPVGHDISLLVPEIWSRLTPEERDARTLIANGHLEAIKDFDHQGRRILASRLGYRITEKFVHAYLGRVFDNPAAVFDERVLRPETQDLAVFVDGIENITEAHRLCAQQYLADGAAQFASPPLLAILDIMATGTHQGKTLADPAIRALFTRESVLASAWYSERLDRRQAVEIARWTRHVADLTAFLARDSHNDVAQRLGLAGRLVTAKTWLERVRSADYRAALPGSIGTARIA